MIQKKNLIFDICSNEVSFTQESKTSTCNVTNVNNGKLRLARMRRVFKLDKYEDEIKNDEIIEIAKKFDFEVDYTATLENCIGFSLSKTYKKFKLGILFEPNADPILAMYGSELTYFDIDNLIKFLKCADLFISNLNHISESLNF